MLAPVGEAELLAGVADDVDGEVLGLVGYESGVLY